MPIDNKVKTVFAALNNNFQSVQADSGLGSLGWWPEEGNHDCLVTDVNMQDSTFKQKDGQTFPGFEIQFSYQLINDPGQDEPRRWMGAPIRLPADMGALTDNGAKTRAEIELRRLKGHLTTCLRREPQNIGAALADLSHRLENTDSVIAVVVKCQYDTAKDGKQYRKEFLQKALST
jgi:hypothetical protein